MSRVSSHSVPFWPDQKIYQYGSELPLLFREEKNFLDNNWPSNGPSQAEVIRQVASANRSWINVFKAKNRDTPQVILVIGKYKLTANVGDSDGNYRLWLSRISYANNQDLQRMLEKGALVEFEGLRVLTGRSFGEGLEKLTRFSSGEYVNELFDVINSPWTADGIEVEEEVVNSLSYQEQEMVDALQSFIDAEYAIEQIAAQQALPFEVIRFSARSQRTTYRLHYEVVLDSHDYERLHELQTSLLVLLDEQREPTEILMEVSDINPKEGQPIIYVSIEKQASNFLIPESGFLQIAAMPTLKNVRSSVVESLQDESTQNPWLLKVASGTYEFGGLNPVEVPLPQSKFPPTKSQIKAINSGAGSDDFTLVLGPPGTGKTTVILQWVKYFATQGKRILVTSQNNKAVDNVLERLAEEKEFECLRLGNENKISSTLESITLDNKAAALQEKMFGRGEDVLEALESQKTFILGLIARKEEISSMITESQNLGKACLDKQVQIEKIEQMIQSSQQDVMKLESNMIMLSDKINHIKGKEWPFFKFLSNIYYGYRAKSLNKKLALKKQTFVNEKFNLTSYSTRLLSNQENLSKLNQRKKELDDAVLNFFKDSTTLVDEIAMPKGGDQASLNNLASLDNLVDQINSVFNTVQKWYEKLKNERQQSLYKILIEQVNVVGATCIGINTKALFRDLDFDVVIVDESGQIQLHNLIVPLSRANKAILVGDHKQLPPIVSDEVIEEFSARGFEEYTDLYRLSWFEHLWDASPEDHKIMLDTQFRCPSIISDFVSEAFYEGKYFAGTGMDEKKPLFSFCPKPMVWIDTNKVPGKAEKSVNQDGRTVVLDNVCETKLVLEVLAKAIQENPELAIEREIGIIVPYANHVKALQTAIRKQQSKGRFKELTMPLNELVASVDSFQGQERDLVIFTFTRSNPRGKVGFLSDWRRLNVAQTRAKKQLIMIGDSEALTKGSNREGAYDLDFKRAMVLLKQTCFEGGALLDAREFLPQKSNKRPLKNHRNQKGSVNA